MGTDSDLEPSQGLPANSIRLSGDLLDAGTQLLDIGTNLTNLYPDQGYQVSAYPTCKEAAIVPFGVGGEGARKKSYRRPDDVIEDSRGRQAKTAVRRICRHNGLWQLVTFTYANVPPLAKVSKHFNYFWSNWKVATGREIPPYVLVCEWGKETGRLHVHVGVNWWGEINAVEVCPACDKFDVIKNFPRVLPENYVCIGCMWGRGFVGRPERNVDGKGLSGYLAKYLVKDLSEVQYDPQTGCPLDFSDRCIPFGGKRYRASLGAKPVAVRLWTPTLEVARAAAVEVAGGGEWPAFSWCSNDAESSELVDVEFHDFMEGAA